MDFNKVTEELMQLQNQIESNKLDTRFEQNKLYAYLGEKVVKIFKKYNVIVAGGMITSLFTNKDIHDVDVYFRSEKDIAGFVEEMWGKHVASHTKKATLFMWGRGDEEVLIQAIHFKYFDTPQDVFETFDFTHVMGAYDFKTEEFVLHRDFLKHNAQRILRFNKNTAFPLISLIRINKYQERGYKISKPELMRIIMTCMKLGINSYDELKEQLGGMYGEAYENAIQGLKDEEFSLDRAIDVLQDLAIDKDYFKKPKQIEFNDLEDLIDSICNMPIRYFEFKGNQYRIGYDGTFKKVDNWGVKLRDDAEKVDVKDILNIPKVYKFVKRKDDKLVSFWKESFEYKVGQVVTTDSSKGLFFNRLEDIGHSTYCYEEKSVLIEAEVEFDNLIGVQDTHLQYSKCKVLREVPTKEYEEFL